MKAVRFDTFGGPEVLRVLDVAPPRPGKGQVCIQVRAAGVNASDWKKRQGLMDQELPQTLGYEAAGVVHEIGEGVSDVRIGDRVFGFCVEGAAQAELAVLTYYARMPSNIDFEVAAALPSAVETAARALDQLGVRNGSILLVHGASGNIGSAAVQLARARGARVIGTASAGKQDFLRSLGAEAVTYGDGMVDRIIRALSGASVDRVLDVAGCGDLVDLIRLAGRPENVITVADFQGAKAHGVRFSRGDDGRALYVMSQIGELIATGQFKLPRVQAFPLEDVADAHRVGVAGKATGKLVLTVQGGS